MKRLLQVIAFACLAVGAPGVAAAHGGGGVNFGFSFGLPLYFGPPPPPVVYAPPPPPVAYPPYSYPPVPAAPPAPPYAPVPPYAGAGQTCREYRSNAMVDGRLQPILGTACLGPDGAWRVVR